MRTRTEAFAPSLHRSIVVVDVAGFANPLRTMLHQVAVRVGLYDVLCDAFAEAGIDLERCVVEDRGDGAMILVPPDVPKILLADRLPERLVAGLRRYNALHSAAATIQLRMGVHAGEVRRDAHGVVGPAVNLAFRMVDAAAGKSALTTSDGVLALIASDSFYRDVIRNDPAADPDSYRRIPVRIKETSTEAWLRLPDGVPAASQRHDPRPPDAGETHDFDNFYLRTYRLVRTVVHARAQDWGLADDVATEALAIAHRRWGDLGEYPNPTTFVVVTARRILSRVQRQRAGMAPPQPLPLNADQVLHHPAIVVGPTDRAVDRAAITQALTALPPDHRESVVLHHILDHPISTIAELLHLPQVTVQTRLHAARQALRELLNDDLGEGGE